MRDQVSRTEVRLEIAAITGRLHTGSWARSRAWAATDHLPSDVGLTIWDGLGSVPSFNEDLESEAPPIGVADMRQLIDRCDALLIVTEAPNAQPILGQGNAEASVRSRFEEQGPQLPLEVGQAFTEEMRGGRRSRQHPSDHIVDRAFEDPIVGDRDDLLRLETRRLEDFVLAVRRRIAKTLAGAPIRPEEFDAQLVYGRSGYRGVGTLSMKFGRGIVPQVDLNDHALRLKHVVHG
jgi:hypothetical protein